MQCVLYASGGKVLSVCVCYESQFIFKCGKNENNECSLETASARSRRVCVCVLNFHERGNNNVLYMPIKKKKPSYIKVKFKKPI